MSLGLDPATLAQISSLGPALVQAQQSQDQMLQGLQTQQQGLAGQAGQAQQALQQAGGQPFNPPSDFASTLASNIGSVLARNPAYSQEAHQRAQLDQQQAFQQRAQNLQSLMDIYNRKADAAERLGDLVTAEKARAAHERVAGVLQQMVTEARMQGALDVAGIRGGATETAAALRAFGTTQAAQIRADAEKAKTEKAQQQQDYFDQNLGSTRNGSKYFDISQIPTSQKAAALEYAKSNGAKVVDKDTRSRLDNAEEVYQDFDDVEKMLRTKLYNGKNPLETAKQGAINTAKAVSGSDPELAAYSNTQDVAIRHIQALAAGIGSGFRLSQNEINTVTRNFPKITDNLPTALAKLQFMRTFLQNKEKAVMGTKFYGKRTDQSGASSSGEPTQADVDYVKGLGIK